MTDGHRMWGAMKLVGRGGGVLVVPLAQVVPGSGFDVAVTVERPAPPADRPTDLAFTGAPLLVLLAVFAALLATGFNVVVSARRREAQGRGGAA